MIIVARNSKNINETITNINDNGNDNDSNKNGNNKNDNDTVDENKQNMKTEESQLNHIVYI